MPLATPKPDWRDCTPLSDEEIEDHVEDVVTYLQSLIDPNIKAIANDCGAPYPRV
jgi:bacterioferritin-associated ferredoxin